MGVSDENGGVVYRLLTLERRVERLYEYEPAVLRSEVKNLSEDVGALKRAFYTFAFGAVGSAVIFALSVFALLGQGL